jgi:iron(III) transport system ATP-binding protein
MSFVEISKLSFAYSAAKVLDHISFSMEKGEIVGVLGQSESGKSTLLRLITGLETPTEGEISISARTIVNARTFIQSEQRGVGMVFQDYALFPHLTAARTLSSGCTA